MASHPTEPMEVATPASGGSLFGARNAPTPRKSSVGLDVLLTKAAVDFQNLSAEGTDVVLRQNLEALREATSLDAIFIARFDDDHKSIASVVAASSMSSAFNPEVFHGESLERLPYLRDRLEHLRIVEIRDTTQPRRDLTVEAARFAQLHVGAILLIGFAIRNRLC